VDISGTISLSRRMRSWIGVGLLAFGAFGAMAVLLALLLLVVRKGAPAILGRRLAEWPEATAVAWAPVFAPLTATLAALAATACGLAWLQTRLRRNVPRHAVAPQTVGTGMAHSTRIQLRQHLSRRMARAWSSAVRGLAAVLRALAHLPLVVPIAMAAGAVLFVPSPWHWLGVGLSALLVSPRLAARVGAEHGDGPHWKPWVKAVLPLLFWSAALVLLFEMALAVLNMGFLGGYPSRSAEKAGILPGIVGTIMIGFASMLVAIPVGIAAAVYLNEFAPHNRITSILRASISNLAGVPSVVFGILGLALFVRAMMLGTSIAAAGVTLGLLTLPIVIVVSEEALKSVPNSMREAAFGLGATRWQGVRHHVLPYSLPGMLTGSILALSRTMGETAPLILIGAAAYIAFLPATPLDSFTALPIQAYNWAFLPSEAFHTLAWGAVLVLILLVLAGNLTAIILRDRYQRKYQW
jgi:phosphate transport system permease protein